MSFQVECEFLSKEQTKQSLQCILQKLLEQLNNGECSILVSKFNKNLSVLREKAIVKQTF